MTSRPKYGFEFPTTYPIKVFGRHEPGFADLVVEIIRMHAAVEDSGVGTRASRLGNYLAVTVVIQAESREQLNVIYSALNDHPQVLMTL